ncbi:MAG: GNAT family protein [Gammaproteobacteria bacterium]|nr:GNAT family protein [Gammaproteobacteria bacterium]
MFTKNEFNQEVGFTLDNWQPAERPQKINLRGEYCVLEPLDVDKHALALFDALQIDNSGESWTYLPYGPLKTYTEFCQWVNLTAENANTLLYAILEAKSNQPIGICGYLNINSEHGSIEVGHLHYSKLLQKSPAATEAMYLMMHQALEVLKYRRYEWKCDSLNQPSINAAKRLGFTFEGIFRQHCTFKNRNRDTAWFSIIDGEWPTIKQKVVKWLDPCNFDVNGNQIKSLRDIALDE